MAAKAFDPTLKALVETAPGDWLALLDLPPAPESVIDADVATVSSAADKVLKVDSDPPYLLHLEFQAGHDSARLPRKLQMRNVLLEDRHELLVRSVAILLRPEADASNLNGLRTVGFVREEPYSLFRYGVVRVWQIPPERLLRGGLGTLPLAPISAVTTAAIPGIITQMEERFSRRDAKARAEELWSTTLILLGLRYPRGIAKEMLRGVRAMRESDTYMMILEEGEAKGEARGALAEARKILLRLGTRRFGRLNAPTKAKLENLADLEQIEALCDRLHDVDTWSALLRGTKPTNPRRQRTNPN